MDKKPSIDLEVIAPISLGILSLVGIGVVLWFGISNNTRVPVEPRPTSTPFRYVLVATEPALTTLTPENTPTSITPISPIILPTDDAQGASTLPPLLTVTPGNALPTRSRTPAPSLTPTIPSILSKVDDTYFELLYEGNWVEQSDVTGAFQETLHISLSVGNTVEFTFVGRQVIVSYQAGPSLGRVAITLDGLTFEVDQANSTTRIVDWVSNILVRGTHTLVIEHLSGGSVNLDSITIPDVATPSPTPSS